MLYRLNEQDVNSGAPAARMLTRRCSLYIVSEMRSGRLNKVLFVGTGALLSAVSPLQGETVPSIAHAVLLTSLQRGDSNGYCAECFKEPEARQLRTDLDALARYNQKAYRRRGDSDSRLLGAEHNSRVQKKVKKRENRL